MLKCFFLFVSLHICLAQNSDPAVVTVDSTTSENNPVMLACPSKHSSFNETYVWERVDSDQQTTVLSSQTASINITSTDAVGLYYCKVGGNTVREFSVSYFVEPVIENIRTSLTFNDGDTNKKLVCLSEGSYPSVQFTWKLKYEDSLEYEEISLQNFTNINITNYANKSVLLFHNLTFDMQAYYQCYAENAAGNGTVEVLIRVKDRLAALWPFLGIVCEVSVLILIIFVYEKKSKKKGGVEISDVGGDVDKPLNTDGEKEDADVQLRNRMSNNNHK